MNGALFTKSTTGLILATGLIAASSVLAHAQDAPVALGASATTPLTASYATVPTGVATLGGHTFDMTSGKMLQLKNGGSASFTVSFPKPTAVHMLLNTANTNTMYAGSPVGTVVLTFSDATTQTATLTVGSNLREWYIGAFGVVNTVTDITPNASTPYVTQAVWTTTVVGGAGSAVIDMLTVPVLPANTSKTLTGVQLNDTNPFGSLQIDLSGLTVQFTAPTPAPVPGGGTGTGTGSGSGSGTGDNACGNHQGHVDADKADKNDAKAEKIDVETADKADKAEKAEKADKNDAHDCDKAAKKPASTTTARHDD